MTGRVEEDGGSLEGPSPERTSPSSLPRRERTTSASTDVSDTGGITPNRRNKRKMTAPKRRSDFSIKRFCPDLSDGRSADEEEDEDDGLEELGKMGVGGHRVSVSARAMVMGGSTGSSPDSRRDSPPSSGEDSLVRTASVMGPNSPPEITMVTTEGLPLPVVHMNSGSYDRLNEGDGVGRNEPSPHHDTPNQHNHRVFSPARLQLNSRHFMSNNNNTSASTPLPGQALRQSQHQHHHHHFHQLQQQQHPNNLIPGASSGLGLPSGLLQQHSQEPQHIPSDCPSPSSSNFPIPSPPSPADSTSSMAESISGGKKTRKNYKNMTRERRVEANARERSRVHTISAAFEALRRAVPSYSYNQKLSKLAILRIACSYIMSLAKLADMDYSDDNRNYSFADCVDMCTRVIQTEGRARRRH